MTITYLQGQEATAMVMMLWRTDKHCFKQWMIPVGG